MVDYLDKNYESAEIKLNYLLEIIPNDTGGLQLLAKNMIGSGRIEAAKAIAVTLLNKNPKDSFALEILQTNEKPPALEIDDSSNIAN